ncbi:MAG: helix-turn-helix domain-containing protein [Halanaerobiales bacterium]|nr:helix-turn-helix domain-containing protein [Halanaerobiales bacterium]
MTLGERLKQARKQKELTLVQVENLTGISQSYLSKIERGQRKKPSLELISELAKLYNVDLNWLIEGFKENGINDENIRNKIETIVEQLNYVSEKDLEIILNIIKVFVAERRE